MTLNIESQLCNVEKNLDFNTKSVDEEDLEDGEILEEGEVPDEDEEGKETTDQENVERVNHQQNKSKTEMFHQKVEEFKNKFDNNLNKPNDQISTTGKKRKHRWDNVNDHMNESVKDKKFRKTEDENSFGPPLEDDLDEDDLMMFVRGASPTRNELSNKHKPLSDRTLDEDYYPDYEYDSEGDDDINKDFRQQRCFNNNRGGGGARGRGRGDRKGGGSSNMGRGRGRFDNNNKGRGGGGGMGGRGGLGNDRGGGRRFDHSDQNNLPDDICQYFMQGKCHRGDNCPYSHDAEPPRKMELCKFYLLECCAKKDKCLYMHSDFPCKYYHTGMDCFDQKCKFSHGELSEEHKNILLKHLESAPKEILGNFPRMSREGALAMIENKAANKTIPSLFDVQINLPPNVKASIEKENSNSNQTPIPSDDEEDEPMLSNERLYQQQNNFGPLPLQQQQRPPQFSMMHQPHRPFGGIDPQPSSAPFTTMVNEEASKTEKREKKKKEKEQHKLEKAKRKAERELKRLEKEEKKRKHEKKKVRKSSEEDDASDSEEERTNEKEEEEKKRKRRRSKSDEDEEEKVIDGLPAHLPKKQRELFMRIQAHQREADTSQQSDNTSENNEYEDAAPGHTYESWYSSDEEEGATPLSQILKTLNQKSKQPLLPTPNAPPKVPLLPTPTNIPNTPGYILPSSGQNLPETDPTNIATSTATPVNSGLEPHTNATLLNFPDINMNQEDLARLLSSLPPTSANLLSTLRRSTTPPLDTQHTPYSSGGASFTNNTNSFHANAGGSVPVQIPPNTMFPSNNVPLPVTTMPPTIAETVKPVKRDPRLLRSSNTLDQPRPLLESLRSTSVATPMSKASDPMSLHKDVDLRLPTLPPLVPPDINRDVDLRSLPFKPVPIHEACKEIDASINSHPPIPWKLEHCTVQPCDYTNPALVSKMTLADPRMNAKRSTRRRSSEEGLVSPNSGNALLRDPRKASLSSPLPRPVATDPRQNRSDPRIMVPTDRRHLESRQSVIDPRQVGAAPAVVGQRSPLSDPLRYDMESRTMTDFRPMDPRIMADPRQMDVRSGDPRTMSDNRHMDPRIMSDSSRYMDPRTMSSDHRQMEDRDHRIDRMSSDAQSRHFGPPMKRADPRTNQEDLRFSYQDSDLRPSRHHHEQARFQDHTRTNKNEHHSQARFQDTDLRLPSQSYHRS